ncbi:MAG TPA: hypothetical protein VFQ12_05025 [Thermoleophilaceae bacterium]|nr:hypothetical protein [Thermoleophilaceae bacterium]
MERLGRPPVAAQAPAHLRADEGEGVPRADVPAAVENGLAEHERAYEPRMVHREVDRHDAPAAPPCQGGRGQLQGLDQRGGVVAVAPPVGDRFLPGAGEPAPVVRDHAVVLREVVEHRAPAVCVRPRSVDQ